MEAVIILGLLACIPAKIAMDKGRNFVLWFVYAFFLWLIALVHSLVIKPNAKADGYKECKFCKSAINELATTCKFCSKDQ